LLKHKKTRRAVYTGPGKKSRFGDLHHHRAIEGKREGNPNRALAALILE
jgi:hypothetical protein